MSAKHPGQMRALMLIGLALTLLGALILSWSDLAGHRKVVWDNLAKGLPRREALLGFPLIAIGTIVQMVAVAVE